MPWEHEPETAVAVAKAAAAGYHVAAIETSPDAVDLYSWDPSWPVCLVFGHETDGVEPAVAAPHRHPRADSDARRQAIAQRGHRRWRRAVRVAAPPPGAREVA